MVFLYFWGAEDIPDWGVSRKILTFLDFITVFGLVSASGLNQIKSHQVARWAFVKLFVPFRIPKIIVMDTDRFFSGVFRKNFHEILLIPVHAVSKVKHKVIRNEGFHWYLKKFQKIKSAENDSLNLCLQGEFFHCMLVIQSQ